MPDSTLTQQLTQWKARVSTITSNLMDLYAAESTKAIRARLLDPAHGFAGETQTRAAHAIATLDDLVDLYTRLANVIDQASDLVKQGGVLRNNDERARALLNGQSITMHTEHVLLRNRGLLDDGDREVRATPAEALARMEQSFAAARDTLSAIADAMAHVQPRLAGVQRELATQDALAEMLGQTRPAALANASLPIARVESDPLGSVAELAPIEDAVARWRSELRAIDADHHAVLASLAAGKATLAELRDLVARSAAACVEASAKIADPAGLAPPANGDTVATLDSWLNSLEHNAAAGRFAAVKLGMAKWEQTCGDQLAVARANYDRNRAGLDERTELRGRFRALCAKADTLRRRGVPLGAAAEDASRQGMTILDAIPFDLPAGRRLVQAFEAALSAARQ
jgi:hypothetical protein